MTPGFAFSLELEGKRVGVVYTSHFVERYHQDTPNRRAADQAITEDEVRQMIEEALSTILSYQESDPQFSGIIKAVRRKVNMTFSVRPKSGGVTVVMKNVMLKEGYHPLKLNDYIIEINLSYTVRFPRSVDPDLRLAVMEHLVYVTNELEDGEIYNMETPEARYVVEKLDGILHIHDADWLQDMLYVEVP